MSAALGAAFAPSPADHAMGPDAAACVAATLKALADPLRLRMLSLIATRPTGEACVCDIATVAEVTQPTVSHHLRVLKDVGVLVSERRATWVFYSIDPRAHRAVTTLLEGFAPATVAAGALGPPDRASGLADVDGALDRIAARLGSLHPSLDAGWVTHTVRESYAALARRGGEGGPLVAITERFAHQRLDDVAQATRSAGARPRPHVLFVCVANAGRSQLAAALMSHHAGGDVVVRSAGSAPAGAVQPDVLALLADLAKVVDGDLDDAYPKPLTDDAVRAADVIVTMGCGDVCPVLPGKRYEDWVVGDPALASPDGVRAIRDELDARVRALLAELLPTQ